jgi:SHS2 domain-containing protein
VNRHRFVEHGGEVEMELESASPEGIFVTATEAFAELVSTKRHGPPVRHAIELHAHDRALLLVDWLNELVYLAEVDGFVPEQVSTIDLTAESLRITVCGRREEPSQLVKAVTLNSAEFREQGRLWHGRVVLDV